MELKEELTRGDVQSIVRMSKLLGDVCNDFTMYHFAIVDQLEEDTEEAAEQEILDQDETKVMELVDRIGELVKEPLEEKRETVHEFATSWSVRDIKGDIGRGEGADVSILVNYMDKTKSLEGKLEGLEEKILSLEEYSGR